MGALTLETTPLTISLVQCLKNINKQAVASLRLFYIYSSSPSLSIIDSSRFTQRNLKPSSSQSRRHFCAFDYELFLLVLIVVKVPKKASEGGPEHHIRVQRYPLLS